MLERELPELAPGAAFLALGGLPARDMVMGDPNAPIEIIEYASMTCGHCARFHAVKLPGFREHCIDTGLARPVFREYSLDKPALAVSAVARCGKANFFIGCHVPDPAEVARGGRSLRGNPRDRARRRPRSRRGRACANDEATVRTILEGMLEARNTHSAETGRGPGRRQERRGDAPSRSGRHRGAVGGEGEPFSLPS